VSRHAAKTPYVVATAWRFASTVGAAWTQFLIRLSESGCDPDRTGCRWTGRAVVTQDAALGAGEQRFLEINGSPMIRATCYCWPAGEVGGAKRRAIQSKLSADIPVRLLRRYREALLGLNSLV